MKALIIACFLPMALSAAAPSLSLHRKDGSTLVIPVAEIASLRHELSGQGDKGAVLLVRRRDQGEVRVSIAEIRHMLYEELPQTALKPDSPRAPDGSTR